MGAETNCPAEGCTGVGCTTDPTRCVPRPASPRQPQAVKQPPNDPIRARFVSAVHPFWGRRQVFGGVWRCPGVLKQESRVGFPHTYVSWFSCGYDYGETPILPYHRDDPFCRASPDEETWIARCTYNRETNMHAR